MTYENTFAFAQRMDREDPIRNFRNRFFIPRRDGEELIYLCGNSLGLQPRQASDYVGEVLEDWGRLGVEGHLHARHPWLPYHEFLTDQMAEIVGAKPLETVVMNSLTVNLHLLMVSFYRPTPGRYKIVIENDAFPSDRYAVASQARFHGFDPEDAILRWEPEEGENSLRIAALESLLEKQGDEIALLMIGGVNYYTGQYFDLERITSLGHRYGTLVGFDLAHAAGNVPLQLHDSDVDFAAWCTYKYMNSGPGGLSGVFIHERHARSFTLPRFAGWWGHNKEIRFRMRDDFDPMEGAEGWQLSNPPILPMAALRASLEIFAEAGMDRLRAKSELLTGYLEFLLSRIEGDRIRIITPKDKEERGCQLSLAVRNADRTLYERIGEAGVVADWREPDVIRVAPVPLYNRFEDVYRFSRILQSAMKE